MLPQLEYLAAKHWVTKLQVLLRSAIVLRDIEEWETGRWWWCSSCEADSSDADALLPPLLPLVFEFPFPLLPA
jgi:hypothetical protein